MHAALLLKAGLGSPLCGFVTNTMDLKKKRKSSRKQGKKAGFSESKAKAAADELGRLTGSSGVLPRW